MSRRAPVSSPRSNAPWLLVAGVGAASLLYGLLRRNTDQAAPIDEVPPIAEAPPGPAPAGSPVMPGTVSIALSAPAATASAAATARCPGCDIVLVTVCSLRRDAVGRYGEHPGLTPAIDRFAEGGYLFDAAYAASNFTLASLTAILTGRFGSSTGVLTWDKGLVADVPTLPEVLGLYGYRTGAFTVDAPSGFRPDYGLDRGFQRMEIIAAPRDTPDGRFGGGPPGPGGDSATPIVEWLGEQTGPEPIFAMFHTRSAHFPFVITDDEAGADPTGIHHLLWEAGRVDVNKVGSVAMPGMAGGTAQKGVVSIGKDPLQVAVSAQGAPAVESWRKAYYDSVGRLDRDLVRLFEALEKRGRLDRTILLLVADHGESLSDHGELLHGDAYWDSVINVPLLLRVPGLPGKSEPIGSLVSHTDILPTLLDLVGAVPPAEIDGRSMVPLLTGEADAIRQIALSEGGVAKELGGEARGAVIAPPYTLLRQYGGCGGPPGHDPPRSPGAPATCLYDLRNDPDQLTNVAKAHPEVVGELQGRWDAFRAARATEARALTLDPAMVEALRVSGYDFSASPRRP